MLNEFRELTRLPGTAQEQAWLEERLETLSVRDRITLAADLQREPPETALDAIRHVVSAPLHTVCFPAGNFAQLGEYALCRQTRNPDELRPYIDLEPLGRQYGEEHPGQFVGNCYVTNPDSATLLHGGNPLPEDRGWSVRLKLASPDCPEGAWMQLPDCAAMCPGMDEEIPLLLDALYVDDLEDCTLLEVRCMLPEAGNLMEQYDSIGELVKDGDELGYILYERGRGEAHWTEKFAAALEYEDCRTLRFALDISRNLRCYEWKPRTDLEAFALDYLRKSGVSEALIQVMDLERYSEDLLEGCGYMLTRDESGYVARNNREFISAYRAPEGAELIMQSYGTTD